MTENAESKDIEQLELFLLKGQMPDLHKMNKQKLETECRLWRNIWNWIPSEVRYYVARTLSIVERYLAVVPTPNP